jgi:hypothetical protein
MAAFSYLGFKLNSQLAELGRDPDVMRLWPELGKALDHLGDALNTIAHDIERELRDGVTLPRPEGEAQQFEQRALALLKARVGT